MPNCPRCEAEVSLDDPAGLCPQCLIQAAIGGAFESSVGLDESGTQTIDAATAEAGGDDFGRYKIVRPIGEGGMGTVYLAEQRDPIRRLVAIKVVKLGLDASEVLARFDNERQALAIMDHPNIARIFDAGATAKGRPYFVMEYIEGATITQYCDRKRMITKTRLALFLAVCRGVQHAHQKGVIHRDLKPSNVLVTEQDGVPVPKVIDFGIAKATDKWAVESTLLTQFGQIVGTPEYASPEQADTMTGDISESSDVYSLGVLLYELLVGAVPFETATLRSAGLAEMLRIIREEEAPSLSRKLTSMGAAATAIAARRQTDPVSLHRLVDGDLNSITMKALEKTRERRYASVSDLAADIQRYMEDRPVLASPPGRLYRTRKLLRRHRLAALGTAAGVVLLVLSGVTAWALSHSASRPELTDKDTIVLADFVNRTGDPVFDNTLGEALAIQMEDSPFLNVLDRDQIRQDLQLMRQPPGARLDNNLAREICQRENEKAMISGTIASLGNTYVITLQATDCQSGNTLARQQAEVRDKEHAIEGVAAAAKGMREKLGEPLSSIRKMAPQSEHVTTASLQAFQMFALGAAQFREGNEIGAIPLLKHAVDLDPSFAMAWIYLATSYGDTDSNEHMVDAYQRAFDLRDRVSERERLFATNDYYYFVTQDWEKHRESAELWARTYPRDSVAHNSLGLAYRREGDLEGALREYKQAVELGGSGPTIYNLARTFARLGRFDEAKTVIRKELARNGDNSEAHDVALKIALIQTDDASRRRELQWYSGKPEEYDAFEMQATDAFVFGQRGRESELLRRAGELRARRNLEAYRDPRSDEDALAGSCESTRRANEPGVVALALCGEPAQIAKALKSAEDAARDRSYATEATAVNLPLCGAAASLSRNHPEATVEQLRSMDRLERVHPEAIYLRGLALIRLGKGAEAAGEFQKIIDNKGNYWGSFYPVSYVGLARGAALAGDVPRARKAYEDFLMLWKDADPNIPILKQAKAEYAKL
jgi:eukaryotic-like serine/threonine-protein kinase